MHKISPYTWNVAYVHTWKAALVVVEKKSSWGQSIARITGSLNNQRPLFIAWMEIDVETEREPLIGARIGRDTFKRRIRFSGKGYINGSR